MSVLTTACLVMFATSVLYAVLGNLAVYFALRSSGIPTRSSMASVPGYLYRICSGSGESVSPKIRQLSWSTNVAWLAALLFSIPLIGLSG